MTQIRTPEWLTIAEEEAWREAQRIIKDQKRLRNMKAYQSDPVKFGREVLGEFYTKDIEKVMYSVMENPVTIARSATGPGKSHGAARIAIWFYKTYDDSKVFTTAAPPLENLKRILWGEIMGVVRKNPGLFDTDTIRSLFIARNSESFIAGLTIPTSGTSEEREAKFCADADDLFEMHDGSLVRYADLVGKKDVPVVSVDDKFNKKWSFGEFFDNGTKLVYQITFEDGDVVRRTGNHPLYAGWDIRSDFHKYDDLPTHAHGRIRANKEGWLPVSDLREGYAILCPDSTDFNFGSEQADENLVKFLAYMIGDGCFVGKNKSSRLQFTQNRNDQLKEFLQILDEIGVQYSISDKDDYNWVCISTSDTRLADLSREWGLHNKSSGDKFVPDFVNRLNKEQIAIFLSRLFSTDGWAGVYKAGSYKKAEIGYSSKSRKLVSDIQRLLLRFGIRSKVLSKTINGEIYWSLAIWDAVDVISFAEQIGIYGKEESVELCCEYSSERSWTYANWKFEKPGYRWKKISSIKVVGQRLTVGVHVPGDNTYLTSLVEHNSGKHAPHLLFIVDEGDAVPEEVYRGIEGCMSGGMARLLIMFNPKIMSGAIYRKEIEGNAKVIKLSAFNHPNVTKGEIVIPGAVDRNITLKRINEWTRPLNEEKGEKRDAACFDVPDFLVGTTTVADNGIEYPPLQAGTRKVINPAFSYMVLGEYPAQNEMQLINQVWIDNARSRYDLYVAKNGQRAPDYVKPIMGLDVAELGTDANACCLRYGGYVPPFITWGGIDTDQSTTKALEIYRQHSCDIAYVDATGIGSSIAPSMSRQGRGDDPRVRAIGVKIASSPMSFIKSDLGEFYQLRDQLWWALREWLRTDPGAMLPPDNYLLDDLRAPTYRNDDRGKIRITKKDDLRKILRRSPDRGDALALTFSPQARAKVIRLLSRD